jgi:hypothetical protein
MEKKRPVLVRFFIALTLIGVTTACGNKETARIRINIAELGNQKLEIEEQRVAGKKFIDSVYVSSQGKLTYKINVKQTGFFNLIFEEGDRIFLLLKPGEKVEITYSDTGVVIAGSNESQKLNNLYDSLFATRNILNKIRQEYNLSINQEHRDSLAQEYLRVTDDHYQFSMRFVLENLTSLTSLAGLYQELSPNEFVFGKTKDLQFFKLTTDSLTKYYPKHRHVLALQRNFKSMLDNYKVDRLLSNVPVTEELPEVSLPNTAGEVIKLSEINKRYVFLNFWTHNDQLSYEIFPGFNTVYSKNKSKDFAIYNVYFGKRINEWKRIVKFEEIDSWINVADTSFPNSRLQWAYNIQALPSNYLIDLEDQTILSRNINPKQLNQRLTDLLSN